MSSRLFGVSALDCAPFLSRTPNPREAGIGVASVITSTCSEKINVEQDVKVMVSNQSPRSEKLHWYLPHPVSCHYLRMKLT